jgi:Carbohydrate binding domain
MQIRTLAALAFLAAALGLGTQASADLVVNGGFETGDFTGWTQAGDTSFTDVESFFVHSGNFAAEFGPTETNGFISQTALLATTPGDTYTLSFWLANDGGTPNNWSVSWGGNFVDGATDAAQFPFTQFSYQLLATSSATDLTFSFFQAPAFYYLDDVSVVSLHPVPEPSTLAIGSVCGLVTLGLGLRRRRRSA